MAYGKINETSFGWSPSSAAVGVWGYFSSSSWTIGGRALRSGYSPFYSSRMGLGGDLLSSKALEFWRLYIGRTFSMFTISMSISELFSWLLWLASESCCYADSITILLALLRLMRLSLRTLNSKCLSSSLKSEFMSLTWLTTSTSC